MPPIFVCLFTHVFLPLFCCIRLHFSSFFLNFHIFGLVWNYFGEYSIGGACSTQLEEGEVAAQRATDDDDQRQWKRDQTSFWQTSTYLTYLPTWTSRAKEHHFFSPFEIWSVKANLHQMKTSFPYFSFLDVEVKSPPNKTVFFQRVFPRKKMFFNSICLRFCCLFIILLKPQRLAVSRSL
jgi:muconolactone delta-isomerase